MANQKIKLELTLAEEYAEAEKLDRLTVQMSRDLIELGADSVERPGAEGTGAAGTKGEAISLGVLLLAIAPVALPNLIKFLQAWTLRGENRRIKIKTPQGLEVEFIPEKRLNEAELLSLVEKLSRIEKNKPDAGSETSAKNGTGAGSGTMSETL